MPARSRTVAAFDFDGTLSRGDSFWRFLTYCRGRRTTAAALARLLPSVTAGVLLPGRHASRAKEALVASLLAGMQAAEIERLGEAFASSVLRHRFIGATVARLTWHQAQGHETVIVSASPAAYLDPAGAILGVDAVLATRLELGPDGRLTGRFDGGNCRGPAKPARLMEWIGERPAFCWAYGNSANDRELLLAADIGIRVGTQDLRRPPGVER